MNVYLLYSLLTVNKRPYKDQTKQSYFFFMFDNKMQILLEHTQEMYPPEGIAFKMITNNTDRFNCLCSYTLYSYLS